MSCYVHSVAGRLRVKTPSLKNQKHKCSNLQDNLLSYYGIVDAKVNPSTGSVIVKYEPSCRCAEDIISLLRDKKIITGDKIHTTDTFFKDAAADAGEKLGKALLGKIAAKTLEANGLSLLTALI